MKGRPDSSYLYMNSPGRSLFISSSFVVYYKISTGLSRDGVSEQFGKQDLSLPLVLLMHFVIHPLILLENFLPDYLFRS